MADRSVVASNTFEQFRVEFNELATDVGDIASITGASGTIASATDVIEAVVQLNNALDAADLDGAGDSGGDAAAGVGTRGGCGEGPTAGPASLQQTSPSYP